jgi:hypothetical protein
MNSSDYAADGTNEDGSGHTAEKTSKAQQHQNKVRGIKEKKNRILHPAGGTMVRMTETMDRTVRTASPPAATGKK